MSSKEIDDKKRLVALAARLKEKFKRLRLGEADYEVRMERQFKPLLKAQEQPPREPPSEPSIPVSNYLLTEDVTFGLKGNKVDSCYNLGSARVVFTKDKISVADREYPITKGLLSLLTRKSPRGYSEEDKGYYKQMLIDTRAHLRKTDGKIKTSGGKEKSTFVKKLFNADEDDAKVEEQRGEGMSWIKLIKESDNIKKSYTYWDDPNELVDRLYLLHASQKAGNNSVSSEIASIESELREAGYIQ